MLLGLQDSLLGIREGSLEEVAFSRFSLSEGLCMHVCVEEVGAANTMRQQKIGNGQPGGQGAGR